MDSDTGAAKKRSDTRGTIKSLADFALAFPTCLVVISYLIVPIFFFFFFSTRRVASYLFLVSMDNRLISI